MFSELKLLVCELFVYCLVLTFIWTESAWSIYLSLRQIRVANRSTQIPEELRSIFTRETFDISRSYSIHRGCFNIGCTIFDLLVMSAVICCELFHKFWKIAVAIVESLHLSSENEIVISIFFLLTYDAVFTIISLPLQVYSTFVIENQYGFNKQTTGFFIADNIKQFIVVQVLACPCTVLAIYIIQIGGEYFFLWLWMFLCIVQILLNTLYPIYIAPLFDNFTPLPDGSLKTAIENLAASQDFPLKELYIVEGSARSGHSNAYVTGSLGSKRIVLYDTLIKKIDPDTNMETGCEEDEIVAILGHEIGHWALHHILIMIVMYQVDSFLTLSMFGYLFRYEAIYTAMGFEKGQTPILIGLLALKLLMIPFSALSSFVNTFISRKLEFQADAYAKKYNYAEPLKRALIKLYKDNLSFPFNDWLYSTWYHGHPTLLQRIEKLNKLD